MYFQPGVGPTFKAAGFGDGIGSSQLTDLLLNLPLFRLLFSVRFANVGIERFADQLALQGPADGDFDLVAAIFPVRGFFLGSWHKNSTPFLGMQLPTRRRSAIINMGILL